MEINWTAAAAIIQAATALITASYVYLTYRLVRAQEQPLVAIRLAAQESAARSLLSSIGSKGFHVMVARAKFPLNQSEKPNAADFEFRDVLSLATELGIAASQLPACAVQYGNNAAHLVNEASIRMSGLHFSILLAERQTTDGATPPWDEIRTVYLAFMQQMLPSRPEWEDIISGQGVIDAEVSLQALNTELVKYLMAIPDKMSSL